MAKTKRKAKTTRKKKGQLFDGDLPTIRKAINKVAKSVDRGRKQAAKRVKQGEKAAAGTPLSNNLAANKAALKKAEAMLAELKQARTMIQDLCCQNDQGCDILVL